MTDLVPMIDFHPEGTGLFRLAADPASDTTIHDFVHSSLGIGELTKGLRLYAPELVPVKTLNELRLRVERERIPEAKAVETLVGWAGADPMVEAVLDFTLERLVHFSGRSRESWLRKSDLRRYIEELGAASAEVKARHIERLFPCLATPPANHNPV
jgi:hypothetical protein